ncbi:TetR/AcrR family transcriptional regulator [Nocardioides sp. CFH 31398]|uniref:TetR/AcrR family transcriptional regulator n=1 Tax=Nocardioides sp. CFH 31398 TaxID=2919579 RepID=UPI001F06C518|nr:TetR/AcrR family transcriptional regulator [Nocardioides sp. CFH 31398]MCH1865872.1 TetR/AcrR family transcriptional regulator [Nocardioides sp. CFH 31398]
MGSGPTPEIDDESDGPVETRRERVRRETVEEIKATAREHLTLASSSQFSLRAVARDVGLTPSAIYRYFGSQQELVGAVAKDAYESVTHVFRAVAAETEGEAAGARLRALGRAYRRWGHDHKAEFNLIFGSDVDDLVEGPSAVGPDTLVDFFATPLAMYTDGVARGEIASRPADAGPNPLSARTLGFLTTAGLDVEDHDLNLLVTSWAAIHGFVALELFGHLARFFDDADAAFDRQLSLITVALGAR